jgi:hypothetical protein
MATVNITIKAMNATKAAFNEVGKQASDLNKRLQKVGSVFKGLFVAGLAAKMVQQLAGMSTNSDKLSERIEKIKKAWSGVAQILGNAVVGALGLITPIIEGIGKAAEWTFQLFETKAQTAARHAANEQKELAAVHIQQEKDKAAADAARVEATKKKEQELAALRKHWHDEEIRFRKEIEGLEQSLDGKRNDRAESMMSDAELLAKRQKELAEAQDNLSFLTEAGFTKRALEVSIDIEGMLSDIDKLTASLNDAMDKAQTESHNAWLAEQSEKQRVEKERIEESKRLQIKATKDAADAAKNKDKENLKDKEKDEGKKVEFAKQSGKKIISFDRNTKGKLVDRMRARQDGTAGGMLGASRKRMEMHENSKNTREIMQAEYLGSINDNLQALISEARKGL